MVCYLLLAAPPRSVSVTSFICVASQVLEEPYWTSIVQDIVKTS